MKSKRFFLMCAIPFALSYWVFDSAIHYFWYGESELEFIPTDINELWMRSAIFVLLIAFGIFADYHTARLVQKENEKHDVYKSMLDATSHILGNFLNNMQLFYLEAEQSKDFNKDVLKRYDEVIDEAVRQIKNLDAIRNPSKEIIEERYKPK